jgi:hypothetical protein
MSAADPSLMRRIDELHLSYPIFGSRRMAQMLRREGVRVGRLPVASLDETPAHPLVASIDATSLCPNAEITVFPWHDPPELNARTARRQAICRYRLEHLFCCR